MVKVVKRVNNAECWMLEHTCEECQADLEIVQEDFKVISNDGDLNMTIVCPNCFSRLIIADNLLPRGIREITTEQYRRNG